MHLEEERLVITQVRVHSILDVLQLKLKALSQLLIKTTRLYRVHQTLMQLISLLLASGLYLSVNIHLILVDY